MGASVSPRAGPGSPQGRATRGARVDAHTQPRKGPRAPCWEVTPLHRLGTVFPRLCSCGWAVGRTRTLKDYRRSLGNPLQSYWPVNLILVHCLQQEILAKESHSPHSKLKDVPLGHSNHSPFLGECSRITRGHESSPTVSAPSQGGLRETRPAGRHPSTCSTGGRMGVCARRPHGVLDVSTAVDHFSHWTAGSAGHVGTAGCVFPCTDRCLCRKHGKLAPRGSVRSGTVWRAGRAALPGRPAPSFPATLGDSFRAHIAVPHP